MSNASEPLPAHLRPITVEIPVTWTPEQALAVFELLDDLRERIWELYNVQLQDLLREQQQSPGLDDSDDHIAPHSVSTIHLTVRLRWPGTAPGNGSPTNNPVVRSRRPSRRPDLRSLSSPRTAAVKHARRAPPKAARSVLDGREHGGIITADGRQVPEARAVYTRVLTAANR